MPCFALRRVLHLRFSCTAGKFCVLYFMESEAPPSAGWYNFLGWLDVNKKRVAIVAAILALVAALVAVMMWRSSQRKDEAALALAGVKHAPGDPATPALAENYLKVAQEYENTPAAAQALVRAGATYFAAGEYQKAQDAFARFLNNHSDSAWVSQAQYGLAACLEAQGKNPEAIAKYSDFLKSYSADPAADQARFSLSRLYEKTSQPAQALDVLTKMTNGLPPFSPIAGEVQERMKAIYAKNPALAPPPVQRMPPMMTPSMLTNNVQVTPQPPTTNVAVPTPGAAPTVAPVPAAPTSTGGAPRINLQAPTNTQPK